MLNVYVIQRYNWDVGWMAVNDLYYTDELAAELHMNKHWLPNETKDTVRVHKLNQAPNPEVEEAKKILQSITPEDIDNVLRAFTAGAFLMAGGPRTPWVEDAVRGINQTYMKLKKKKDTVRKPSPDMVWVDGNKPKVPPTNSSLQDKPYSLEPDDEPKWL